MESSNVAETFVPSHEPAGGKQHPGKRKDETRKQIDLLHPQSYSSTKAGGETNRGETQSNGRDCRHAETVDKERHREDGAAAASKAERYADDQSVDEAQSFMHQARSCFGALSKRSAMQIASRPERLRKAHAPAARRPLAQWTSSGPATTSLSRGRSRV